MAAQFASSQGLADVLTSVVNDLTGHLQLSFHGHVIPLPSSRTVGACLCALAIARVLPSLLSALPLRRLPWVYVVLVCTYLLSEVVFYMVQRRRIHRRQAPVTTPPTLPPKLASWYQHHLLSLHNIPLDQLVRGWFFDAPLDDIYRDNVRAYFSYIFTMEKFEGLAEDVQKEVDGVVDAIEQRTGHCFAPGFNPSIRFMAHLWEPLRVVHIPLFIYAAMEIAGHFTNLVLWCMGFSSARDPSTGLMYWLYDPQCGSARAGADGWLGGRLMHASRHQLHRLHDSFNSLMELEMVQEMVVQRGLWQPSRGQPRSVGGRQGRATQQPIVFLHGVMGILLCLPLIKKIQNKCSDQPMLLLDVRSVSMRFTTTTTDYDTVAHAAANILDTHNLPPAILVAHSYGTLVATRMQRMYAHMLTGLVLLEPVSLLPVWPSLLNNFVYQVPTIRKALCSWRMLIIWARSIILAKELAVAETFCRKFLWYELILWPQEVPRGSIVALAGRDDLVPSELVAASLGKGVQVLYEAEGTHGECLINLPCADRVAHAVGRMVARMQTKKR